MLTAAAFLAEFQTPHPDDAERMIPWAHLDIAGPAENPGAGFGYTGTGPTGTMVRTLLRYLESKAH